MILAILMLGAASGFAIEPNPPLSPAARMLWDFFMEPKSKYYLFTTDTKSLGSSAIETEFKNNFSTPEGRKAVEEFLSNTEVQKRLKLVQEMKKARTAAIASEYESKLVALEKEYGFDFHPEKRFETILEESVRKSEKERLLTEKEAVNKTNSIMFTKYPNIQNPAENPKTSYEYQQTLHRARLDQAKAKVKVGLENRKRLLSNLKTELDRVNAKNFIRSLEYKNVLSGLKKDSEFAFDGLYLIEPSKVPGINNSENLPFSLLSNSPHLKTLYDFRKADLSIYEGQGGTFVKTPDGKEYRLFHGETLRSSAWRLGEPWEIEFAPSGSIFHFQYNSGLSFFSSTRTTRPHVEAAEMFDAIEVGAQIEFGPTLEKARKSNITSELEFIKKLLHDIEEEASSTKNIRVDYFRKYIIKG